MRGMGSTQKMTEKDRRGGGSSESVESFIMLPIDQMVVQRAVIHTMMGLKDFRQFNLFRQIC